MLFILSDVLLSLKAGLSASVLPFFEIFYAKRLGLFLNFKSKINVVV